MTDKLKAIPGVSILGAHDGTMSDAMLDAMVRNNHGTTTGGTAGNRQMKNHGYTLTIEQLTDCWRIWINDRSLRSTLRFGQYVLNKTIPRGLCWPEVYYANSERSYTMLWQLTQGHECPGIRKVA